MWNWDIIDTQQVLVLFHFYLACLRGIINIVQPYDTVHLISTEVVATLLPAFVHLGSCALQLGLGSQWHFPLSGMPGFLIKNAADKSFHLNILLRALCRATEVSVKNLTHTNFLAVKYANPKSVVQWLITK